MAPLAQPRQRHTATVLADGTVLFTGGWARGVGDLRSVERYDPRTGAVATVGDLLRARSYHTATALPDGSVLVVGGTTDDVAELSSAELVDATCGFRRLPVTVTAVGDMAFGRAHHVAVPVLGDGHVLILGGIAADGPVPNAELYDPVTRTFSPVMSLLGTLRGATAVRLGDAADAKCWSSDGATRAQWLYDPATGTATSAASLPAARDGQVRAATGWPRPARRRHGLRGYRDAGHDPRLRIRSRTPSRPGRAWPLVCARGPRPTQLPDGRDLHRGWDGPDGEWLATAELFDPASRDADTRHRGPGERGDSTVSGLGSGDVVVAGGTDGRQTLAALDILRPMRQPPRPPVAATVVMRVKPACDQARVLTGRGGHGLPVTGSNGTLATTRVRTLRPGDRLTVDVAASGGRLLQIPAARVLPTTAGTASGRSTGRPSVAGSRRRSWWAAPKRSRLTRRCSIGPIRSGSRRWRSTMSPVDEQGDRTG